MNADGKEKCVITPNSGPDIVVHAFKVNSGGVKYEITPTSFIQAGNAGTVCKATATAVNFDDVPKNFRGFVQILSTGVVTQQPFALKISLDGQKSLGEFNNMKTMSKSDDQAVGQVTPELLFADLGKPTVIHLGRVRAHAIAMELMGMDLFDLTNGNSTCPLRSLDA